MDEFVNRCCVSPSKRVKELKRLRFAAKHLPEGTLLNVSDQFIMELGHAMLLDGESTAEINLTMLKLFEEELTRTTGTSAINRYGSGVSTYPRYRSSAERLRRSVNKGWKQ